jgi:hypothetical protein
MTKEKKSEKKNFEIIKEFHHESVDRNFSCNQSTPNHSPMTNNWKKTLSIEFLVATSPHLDHSSVTNEWKKKELKKGSLWKVLTKFSVATNPHFSHSPTTKNVDQIFNHNQSTFMFLSVLTNLSNKPHFSIICLNMTINNVLNV